MINQRIILSITTQDYINDNTYIVNKIMFYPRNKSNKKGSFFFCAGLKRDKTHLLLSSKY